MRALWHVKSVRFIQMHLYIILYVYKNNWPLRANRFSGLGCRAALSAYIIHRHVYIYFIKYHVAGIIIYTYWHRLGRGRADVLFVFDTAAFAVAATLRKTGISGPNTLYRTRYYNKHMGECNRSIWSIDGLVAMGDNAHMLTFKIIVQLYDILLLLCTDRKTLLLSRSMAR